MSNNFKEIVAALKQPFAPEDHTERDLPGGQKWFFISWQKIRDRLDDVCPDWQVEYGTPVYLDKFCVVNCKLTIAGVTRQALGNAEIELLSKSGRDMSRGSPIERAIADAFKNAAESFGVASYLDEQSQDKREFVMRYLHSQGDSRGLVAARNNGWVNGNLPTTAQKQARAANELKQVQVGGRVISPAQVTRFQTIARQEGGYTVEGAKKLLETYGLTSSKQIPADLYSEICEKAGDRALAASFNQAAVVLGG